MSTPIHIRNFRWDDVPETIMFVNRSNNSEKTPREITPSLFIQSAHMPGLCIKSDFFVAVNSSQAIIGFMKIIKEPKISRFVMEYTLTNGPDRSQVFILLLDTAYKYFKNTNLKFMHVQAVHHDSDIIKFLENFDFKRVKEYWTYLWKKQTLPKNTIPDGFHLTHFVQSRDESALTSLQNQIFSHHWGFAPNTIEEITARVSMERNDKEGIVILKDGAKFTGYNWTLVSNNGRESVGWISMTGIHPDYRGQKLGKEIVLAGMHHLSNLGVTEIELEVDSDNKPATKLYLDLGFQKIGTNYWFENQHPTTE